ncbi:unnamed protein product [Caenorhabditis auriculariae]|uniref:Neuroendocrine protein 7B2 n=1 Tax=Caenorhabditis auriculariae TaxID=2777116 RepID=A0A8S1HJF2_9PELO|nr:unnamed protein product [Caenorhabditis auriculariae]
MSGWHEGVADRLPAAAWQFRGEPSSLVYPEKGPMLVLVPLFFLTVNAFNLETPDMMLPSRDIIELISRDAENVPDLSMFGAKHISGGAGEGSQKLQGEEEYRERQEVKSDAVLPAYCEPPNPCPVGYTKEDGCLDEFENSAEFSRNYQADQHCICDQEHMFNCAEKEAASVGETLEQMLEDNGIHRSTMAKKFHEKRSSDEYVPRRKRSAGFQHKTNPYLQGTPLRSMQKKDGRHAW